jgi:hypothetical protein
MYRINAPDGKRVQLHSSPSDRNWRAAAIRQLNASGFEEAERQWLAADEQARRERIEADRRDADAKAAKLAAQDKALSRAAGQYVVQPVDVAWLLTPTTQPQTRTVLMTPEAAGKALDTINTHNRKKRDHRTEEFVVIITSGEWGVTHQGAAVDSNGVLQDGQHRFQAIVDTGVTVPMQVSVGMPPENFRKVDIPMLRTARDAAAMRGEVNVGVLTAAARMLVVIDMLGTETHVRQRRTKVSIDRVDAAILRMGDDLRQAVVRAKRIRRDIKVSGAALAASIYSITMRLPEGDPRPGEFFNQIETGIGIGRDHPVWMLRRLLIRSTLDRRNALDQWVAYAYILKAWGLAMRGVKVTGLYWRDSEPYPAEPFLPPPLDSGPGSAPDDEQDDQQ